MGDAADDMLDGSCCEQCGVWMDDIIDGEEPPGHTRPCAACGPKEQEIIRPTPRKRGTDAAKP